MSGQWHFRDGLPDDERLLSLEWERPGHVATVVGRADAPALAGEGHHERLAAASTQGTVESEAEDAAELAASGNGAGFKMGNTFTGVRHVVRNCVSIRNKVQGFYANHSHGGSDWLGNVAYANRGAAFDMLSDVVLSGTGVHRLRDNIAFPATIRNDGASDMQHNSWNLGITFTAADFESLSDERFLAPRMPDGGLPDLDLPTLPRAGDALWASPASPGT